MSGRYSKTNNHSNLYKVDGPDGHDDEGEAYTKESSFLTERWSPESVGTLHRFSDLDSSPLSQHHTLGPGHSQASPGDHTHNGATSKSLFWTFSGTGTTNSVGGLVVDTGAPFSTISAAFIQYDQSLRSGGPFCSGIWYDIWTPINRKVGTQWYNGTTPINAGVVFYRGVVFP